MIRRSALAAALFLLAGLAAASEPAKAPPAAADKPAAAPFVHMVVFHLKKDAPAGTADKVIADCHAMLETIPSVKGIKAGPPAPEGESTPKVSLHDYDIGLVVLFDDAAGLKTYLNHETHLKFVSLYEKYFDKVEVYDFADAQKK
jgi:hypothetical protein